jgi:hypothetical protein
MAATWVDDGGSGTARGTTGKRGQSKPEGEKGNGAEFRATDTKAKLTVTGATVGARR